MTPPKNASVFSMKPFETSSKTPIHAPRRSQLACTDGYQIHQSHLTCRLTTAQPDVHPEETSPQPNRHTLANDGRRDCHRSPTRPNGWTFPSPHMVPMQHGTITSIRTYTNSPTPSRCRAHRYEEAKTGDDPDTTKLATCMTDQPYHHTPDHYTWLAQFTAAHNNTQPLVWGHDHDGAYRQLPLDDPSVAYVLLITPDGPTLWHHHVLLFGSAASVWAYNRFGDMLTAIARTLACIPVIHYVDDYGSIEPSHLAESGFHTFEHCSPRRSPLRPVPTKHTIIYTDAFYTDGDKQMRLHQMIQDPESVKPSAEMPNGWAAVISSGFPYPTSIQWHCTSETPQTLCQQQSLYLFPGSVGSDYHTSADTTYHFSPTPTSNFVTTMLLPTPSLKDPANICPSTTSLEHIGPCIAVNTYAKSYTEYPLMLTLPTHLAAKISPLHNN